MTELTHLSLTEAREKLKAKEITAVELTQAYLDQMAKTKDLNAYITETSEKALTMARESDQRLQKGEGRSLEGIPLAIKDIFCTLGVRTTAGSKILGEFTPRYESTVTENLWQAGAVLLGKTNMDEFAMGSSNLSSAFRPVINPWKALDDKQDLVPGGSSGGSAAAVAGHAAVAAMGTDTGGSIRQPAAFCGIVGLKPTYGRCSRYGIIAFASSLDQAGPMTATVADAAALLKVTAGYDPKDATSVNCPVPEYEQALQGNLKNLRVGIPKEYQVKGTNPEITALWQQGIEWLKSAGAVIKEVSLPHTPYALPTYYVLAPAEASSNLARYDGIRYGARVPGETLNETYENTRALFGEEVKRRIIVGTYVLSAGYYEAYYLKAQRVRRLIAQDFKQAFQDVDVLLTPSTPTAAFSLKAPPTDPIEMYMNDVLTVPINLAGLPAISVPAGLNEKGLPLGLQLIGDAFAEETLLRTAKIIEEAAQFPSLVEKIRKAS